MSETPAYAVLQMMTRFTPISAIYELPHVGSFTNHTSDNAWANCLLVANLPSFPIKPHCTDRLYSLYIGGGVTHGVMFIMNCTVGLLYDVLRDDVIFRVNLEIQWSRSVESVHMVQ